MSYILDALRKADAQRERDPARGIHAQAIPHPGSSPRGRSAGKPLWIGGGLVLVALLLGGGWLVSREEPVQRAVAVAADPPAVAPEATAAVNAIAHVAPDAVSVPAPTEPNTATSTDQRPARGLISTQQAYAAPGMPHTARGAAGAAHTAAPAVAQVAPLPPPLSPVAPATSAVLAPPAESAPVAPLAVPAAAPPSTAAVSPPPLSTAGLPSDAPKISITGGVYSASAAQRMLIVNGQVFNEGSEIAPGVTVEQIKARTAVLKFKGTRYTVAY